MAILFRELSKYNTYFSYNTPGVCARAATGVGVMHLTDEPPRSPSNMFTLYDTKTYLMLESKVGRGPRIDSKHSSGKYGQVRRPYI